MAAAASAPARRDFSKGTLLRETRSREGRERGRTTTQREWVERGSGMVGACRAAIDSFLPPEPASLLSLSASLHLSVPTLGWLFVRSLSAPSSRYCHSKHLFALASPATTPYYNKTAPRLFYFSRFIFFLLFFFFHSCLHCFSAISIVLFSSTFFHSQYKEISRYAVAAMYLSTGHDWRTQRKQKSLAPTKCAITSDETSVRWIERNDALVE